MDIQVKFDYKEALKEYNKVVKNLQDLSKYKVVIKIDENKVYEKTGIKVERVAFYMEYGKDELNVHYPARPFWRNTYIKYKDKIQKRFEFNVNGILKGKLSPYQFYEDLGKQFKTYLIATIKEGNFVPLAESTLTIENTSGNPEEIKKIVTNVFEEVNKKQLEVLKVGYGSQFALGGAY